MNGLGSLGLAAGLAGLGLAARFHFWRPNQAGLPVLMYHYLRDDVQGVRMKKLRVRPRAFVRQMDWLKKKGYETVCPTDCLARLSLDRIWPEKPVMITFDDGVKECLTLARDVLAERAFRAVVFPVTGLIGRTNLWDLEKGEPQIDLLTWAELECLVQSGWEIGSHTRTHPDLTLLSDQDLNLELAGAKKDLEERLGIGVSALAYPFGRVDERVKTAAREAGYRMGLTIRHGKNLESDDPWSWKRLMVKRKDTLWDFSLKLHKGRSTF